MLKHFIVHQLRHSFLELADNLLLHFVELLALTPVSESLSLLRVVGWIPFWVGFIPVKLSVSLIRISVQLKIGSGDRD